MSLITNLATIKPFASAGTMSVARNWINLVGTGAGECYAQWGQIPITASGVYVIAGTATDVTAPESGNTTNNGATPVWAGNFESYLFMNNPKTVTNKTYVETFTVPAGTKTLTWRFCAPNGGKATWSDLFVGLKTDYDIMQSLGLKWFDGSLMPLN